MRASILIVALIFTFLIQGSQGSADIQPVPLQDITLRYNSRYDKAVSLNREYILGIETDRLLKNFRYASNWTEAVETSAAIGILSVLWPTVQQAWTGCSANDKAFQSLLMSSEGSMLGCMRPGNH